MPRWGICFSLLSVLSSSGWAQERLTQEEALRHAFPPPATIERRTAYLDDQLLARAQGLAGAEGDISQRVVTYYLARERGVPVGVAYFDGHVVRTKSEVAMIVVDSGGRIRRVEILRFDEPPEYRASDRWLAQFDGRRLSPDLSLKGDILNLTGASLTSRALVRATRRVLALHAVVNPFQPAR